MHGRILFHGLMDVTKAQVDDFKWFGIIFLCEDTAARRLLEFC